MYIDKRYYEVELKGIEVKQEDVYDGHGEAYRRKHLYCKKCNTNLTDIINNNNGDYEINYCTTCGVDLRK